MSNATALRTVLAHVQDNPQEWEQYSWNRCFAGQALRVLTEASPVQECGCCDSVGLLSNGRQFYGYQIGVEAALLLGLEPRQAERLFQGHNKLADLARIIDDITAEEVSAPAMALVA